MWIPVKSWSQVEQQLNADDAQFPVSSTVCYMCDVLISSSLCYKE